MSEDHVIGLLEDHLSSNEWMILSVGDLNSRAYQDCFRIGQTLHNNQYAVVELAEFGYFPGGTIFAVKPRPRRKGRGVAALSFIEVHDDKLAEREFVDVMDRVNWSRVIGIIKGRIRWEKRIAEHGAMELEIEESLDLDFQLYISVGVHFITMDIPDGPRGNYETGLLLSTRFARRERFTGRNGVLSERRGE